MVQDDFTSKSTLIFSVVLINSARSAAWKRPKRMRKFISERAINFTQYFDINAWTSYQNFHQISSLLCPLFFPASFHSYHDASVSVVYPDRPEFMNLQHNWVSTQCSVLKKTSNNKKITFHMHDFLQYSKYFSTCCDSIRSSERSSVLPGFFHPRNHRTKKSNKSVTLQH